MGNLLICIPSELCGHQRNKDGNLELTINTTIPYGDHFGTGDQWSLNEWLNKHCNSMVNIGRLYKKEIGGYEIRIIEKVHCKVDTYKR